MEIWKESRILCILFIEYYCFFQDFDYTGGIHGNNERLGTIFV